MRPGDNLFLVILTPVNFTRMIDLKKFRANPEAYIKATSDKQFSVDFPVFQKLDSEVIELKGKLDDLLAQRNTFTKEFEAAKKEGK